MDPFIISAKANIFSIDDILNKIKNTDLLNQTSKKIIVGVSGIPGSGKSTFSKDLKERLPNSIIIPLDGYHIQRKDLTDEQLKFRGRPDTFDLIRFKEDFLKFFYFDSNGNNKFYFPSFDHNLKDPLENDIVLSGEKIFIFEGLYLFLDDLDIKEYFDLKIFLITDINSAMNRVAKRNYEAGISKSLIDSVIRTEKSDKLNAIYVLENSNLKNELEGTIYYSYID